jgi:hypothetical protein
MRAADRASPWWYGAGLLAIALVCGGVLLVRPAANASRWARYLPAAGSSENDDRHESQGRIPINRDHFRGNKLHGERRMKLYLQDERG